MKAQSQSTSFREAFHERMHANNMYGLWELASQMTPHPQPKMIAHMWPWSLTEPIIAESADAVPVGDERRALQLFNPGLGGRWATTNNLIAAVQVLLPGEVARAHQGEHQLQFLARAVARDVDVLVRLGEHLHAASRQMTIRSRCTRTVTGAPTCPIGTE